MIVAKVGKTYMQATSPRLRRGFVATTKKEKATTFVVAKIG